MRVVTIKGPAGSGKSTMLQAGCDAAGPEARIFSGDEFESVLGMLERKTVGLSVFTFVDECDSTLLARIRKLAKSYSNDYVITVVVKE